jgi:hypothetical protein
MLYDFSITNKAKAYMYYNIYKLHLILSLSVTV